MKFDKKKQHILNNIMQKKKNCDIFFPEIDRTLNLINKICKWYEDTVYDPSSEKGLVGNFLVSLGMTRKWTVNFVQILEFNFKIYLPAL